MKNSCENAGCCGGCVRDSVAPLPSAGGVQLVRHPSLHGALVSHVLQDDDLHQQRHKPHSLQRHVHKGERFYMHFKV
ncbi:hypothetical protein CDAR_513711 [Caerostris darwini]|uniref:Uncharacterized protein n=1 Tax=Caerostris darwini TaxID=1538125 RepID=A0AAV4SWA7_9ARAC|nr:hypothetical protein CDAR_513711 [Caerostris darwini]